jgi:hypothetical protein
MDTNQSIRHRPSRRPHHLVSTQKLQSAQLTSKDQLWRTNDPSVNAKKKEGRWLQVVSGGLQDHPCQSLNPVLRIIMVPDKISHHPKAIWVFVCWAFKKVLSRVNKVIKNWQRPLWGGDQEVVKRSGRDEPICIVIHMHMEASLGISLYTYPYLK